MAMVDIETIDADNDDGAGTAMPQQLPVDVNDYGMGDMLYHDEARLRVLLERHHLHTGSKRASALLDNWEESLSHFVKVMPRDYAGALKQIEAERLDAIEAAE